MSEKKKVFRYLIWLIYTLMTGTLLAGLTGVFCAREGLAAYWGVLIVGLYAAAVDMCVFLIHRAELGMSFSSEKYRILLRASEGAAVIVFLGVGLRLRIEGADGAAEQNIYYEMARISEGGEIPRMAHGAVYVYLRLLQFVLTFFENQFAAGIWLQILLQTAALLGLYFIVRKLAGAAAALVMLTFGMCAPYMVQNALLLSPEMLYFGFLTAAGALVTAGYDGKLKTPLFLCIGFLTGLCTYLDIIGILLLAAAGAGVFRQRGDEAGRGKKAAAALLCLAGACGGFLGCIFLEAVLGGMSFLETTEAWLMLYQPNTFRIPAVMSGACSELEGVVLLGLMTFGIFSFWCNPQKERITMWMPAAIGIMLAACFGIFTNEMPGYFYLYVLFVVMGGTGAGQCFYERVPEAERTPEAESAPENLPTAERTPEDGRGPEPAAPEPEDGKKESDSVKQLRIELERLEAGGGSTEKEGFEEPEAVEKMKETEEKIKFIENPLPVPKSHVKHVMDYPLKTDSKKEDFDHPTAADDDFDI